MRIVLILLVLLVHLTYYGSNAGPSRTANNRSFEASAEDRAEHRSARSADKGSLARTDAALVRVIAVAVSIILAIVIARIVVLSTSTPIAHASIERRIITMIAIFASIPIAVLGAKGKQAGSQQQ